MVHETKLLTFWRSLNEALRQRGARPVDLDVAEIFFTSGLWTVDEVADVLAVPAKRYADDFADPDAIGAIMPYRTSAKRGKRPAWV